MSLTGRQVAIEALAMGAMDDEVDFYIKQVGTDRIKASLRRVEANDPMIARKREQMPESMTIDGVVYRRTS